MKINKTNALMHTLHTALTQCRPHGAAQTLAFTHWLRDALPKRLRAIAHFDNCSNLHIDNRTDLKHRTLFVAHVDTVHSKPGPNHVTQSDALWSAASPEQCLGADDGAGVALLMHMLHHNVPGYYIFTQGEERGGIGAKYLAKEYVPLLMEFDRAVAFDRRGTTDVITHQGWGRCCSDEFASALATALNDAAPDALMLMPDATGIYTDTAEFVDVVPECTNISVGYDGAHGDKECLNMNYYKQLSLAVVSIAWDALPTKRDPLEPDPDSYMGGRWDSWQTQWGTMPVQKTAVNPNWRTAQAEWELENDLLDALYDARAGYTTSLIKLMAEIVYPEDPSMARKQVNRHLISDEYIEWAQQSLYDGVPPNEILEDLFYGCQIH